MKIVFRVFAVLIFLGGLSMLHPAVHTRVKTLLAGNGPRSEEPVGSDTWRFSRVQSDDAGTYFLYEPERKEGEGRDPLVVVLHGAPGLAYAAAYLVEPRVQQNYRSFILIPTTTWSRHWAVPGAGNENAPTALPEVVRLIGQLQKEHPIDPERIYVIGCSDGGTGTYAAISRYPGLFAGAVAISGWWNLRDVPDMAKTPLRIMNGAKDEVVAADLGHEIAMNVKLHGGEVEYIEYPNKGHQCPSEDYYSDATWGWLFSQKKPRGPQ